MMSEQHSEMRVLSDNELDDVTAGMFALSYSLIRMILGRYGDPAP
jgi:hypothetical protein